MSPRVAKTPRIEEVSAGGLVLDRSSTPWKAALIARVDRRGRLIWSLPKGHVEAGETNEQAAIREVEEETGIQSSVLMLLGTIDFWFMAEEKRIHKTVHHFILDAQGGELSDEDREVDEVAWIPIDEVEGKLAYPDERKLMARVPELLAGLADA
jgi:8-oxo-dGTP pyrophosphatase MutT (NUDIX family)